jgi:hypothetical protein
MKTLLFDRELKTLADKLTSGELRAAPDHEQPKQALCAWCEHWRHRLKAGHL